MVTTPFNYVVPMDSHPLINHFYIVFISMYPMYHWIFKALVLYHTWDPPGISKRIPGLDATCGARHTGRDGWNAHGGYSSAGWFGQVVRYEGGLVAG